MHTSAEHGALPQHRHALFRTNAMLPATTPQGSQVFLPAALAAAVAMLASVCAAVVIIIRANRQRKGSSSLAYGLGGAERADGTVHAWHLGTGAAAAASPASPAGAGAQPKADAGATGEACAHVNPAAAVPACQTSNGALGGVPRLGCSAAATGRADEWQQIAAAGQGIDWGLVKEELQHARRHRVTTSRGAAPPPPPTTTTVAALAGLGGAGLRAGAAPGQRQSQPAGKQARQRQRLSMMRPSPLIQHCNASPRHSGHNRFSVLQIV